MTGPYWGKYRGLVINNIDPNRMGRLQVACTRVLGANIAAWAMPCVPFAGASLPDRQPEGFFMIKQGITFHSNMKDSVPDFHYGPVQRKSGYHGALDQGPVSERGMAHAIDCVAAMKVRTTSTGMSVAQCPDHRANAMTPKRTTTIAAATAHGGTVRPGTTCAPSASFTGQAATQLMHIVHSAERTCGRRSTGMRDGHAFVHLPQSMHASAFRRIRRGLTSAARPSSAP